MATNGNSTASTSQLQTELIVMTDYSLINSLLPTYDGNTKSLNYYIRSVECIIRAQRLTMTDKMFACLVRAKLTGKALEALSMEIDIESWESISKALQNRFSEHRSEMQLLRELAHCPKNKNESYENYGKRIRDLLDAISGISTQPIKYYQTMAIDTFLHNLDNNIGVLVRLYQPKTLEAAIAIARQEETQYKIRNQTNTPNVTKEVSFNRPPIVYKNHPNGNYQRPNFIPNTPNWKYQNQPNFQTRPYNDHSKPIKQETNTNDKKPFTHSKPVYQIEASEIEPNLECPGNTEDENITTETTTDFLTQNEDCENFTKIDPQYNHT